MTKIDFKETAISTTKSLFSIIPFAGGALNEIFFDYRGRIKQNRINSFAELLSEFFIHNQDIDLESLKTEEFSDLFEAVIRRVALTKSKEKHLRYRDILTQQIFNPTQEIENSETYLDLIGALDEIAIKILWEHNIFSLKFSEIDPLRKVATDNVTALQNQINSINSTFPRDADKAEQLKEDVVKSQELVEAYNTQVTAAQYFRTPEYFGIEQSKHLYYKQTLYARGLLIDKGFGTFGGSQPFQYTWITEFGKDFINFITTN